MVNISDANIECDLRSVNSLKSLLHEPNLQLGVIRV